MSKERRPSPPKGLPVRKIVVVPCLAAALAAAVIAPTPAATAFRFSIASLDKQLGGEPSIATGPGRWVYATYPGSSGMAFFRSRDGGAHWAPGAIADSGSGDDSINVDRNGVVYQSNLNGNLQADMYRSTDHGSHWIKGTGTGTDPQAGDAASDQPFAVDRPWADAYAPSGKPARVYVNYHDFGPSLVWVNASTDGGRTFGSPVSVVTAPDAIAATACNSSPAGVKVVQSGPHAGRVYVAWLAADIATSVATGCNYTQMDTFHTVWIAWSDDEGKTWTDHLILDAGFTHDGAAFWGDIAVDTAGNPYVAFSMNLYDEWDALVMASFDGGTTWNGSAAGTGIPFRANTDKGTHFFPAIAAGWPGSVVVAWLRTPVVVPTLPYGKPMPGGDPSAQWNVYLSQSTSLRSANPKWSQARITRRPMHTGDICTLGIFCLPRVSDRNLLDFIDVAIDSAGRAHVAYTDDHDRNCICVASQTGGPALPLRAR